MYITEKNLLKYALYANAIYVCFLFLFRPDGITIQKITISSFLLLSVLAMYVLCFRGWNSLSQIPKTAKRVFVFLILWSAIVVLRSFSLKLQDWVTNFGNVYMALAWFTPLLIVIGQKLENWKIIIKAIFFMFYLMMIAILFYPFQSLSTTEWTWLLRPLNFIILIGLYRYKLLDKITIFITLIIYVFIGTELEQRIEFMFLGVVMIMILIDTIKHIKIKKVILKYILFGFLFLLLLVFTYGYENISLIVYKAIEFQDSRTFLFNELLTDLTKGEQIFGRGSLGTYYSDFFRLTREYYERMGNTGWRGDSATRITIEVGYLQMILKGGFLLFGLTAFLMFNAAYLALFKSKNRFVKRLGLFILILSILSLVSFRPAFTPTFIILWIAIGTVLNKKNRGMNNKEIEKLINFK